MQHTGQGSVERSIAAAAAAYTGTGAACSAASSRAALTKCVCWLLQDAGLKVKEYELIRRNFSASGNFGEQRAVCASMQHTGCCASTRLMQRGLPVCSRHSASSSSSLTCRCASWHRGVGCQLQLWCSTLVAGTLLHPTLAMLQGLGRWAAAAANATAQWRCMGISLAACLGTALHGTAAQRNCCQTTVTGPAGVQQNAL